MRTKKTLTILPVILLCLLLWLVLSGCDTKENAYTPPPATIVSGEETQSPTTLAPTAQEPPLVAPTETSESYPPPQTPPLHTPVAYPVGGQ